MKLLVSGGAGYIGSHVVRQLTETGHKVTVIDNLSTGFSDSLIHSEDLIRGDIGDEALLDSVFSKGFDGVLHFAGSILVEESVREPGKYFENNTVNSLKLLKTVVKHGVKNFIFSSTAAVYGFPAGGIANEDTEKKPCNPYGFSKLMTEQMIQDMAQAHGFNYGILRYFNVAGADPQGRMGQRTPKATHLIKVACEVALGKRPGLEIFGTDYPTPDGTCQRDYIHVEDLASAHLMTLDYLAKQARSTILNVGYGHGFSVLEVIEKVQKVSGRPFEVKKAPRRAGDPASLISQNEKIKSLLGWKPQFDNLETIVAHAFQWEKNCTKK